MNWSQLNFTPAFPEIFLLAAALVILMVDAFTPDKRRALVYGLALLTLAGCAWLQYRTWTTVPVMTFSGMFVADSLGGVIKFFMYGITAAILIYSRQYIEERGMYRGEYFSLMLFALLGMNVMVSASHFMTLYIGLELLSLSMYAMIALRRDSVAAAEAAMKYFVLGAMASGFLLYGMSLIYGATGALQIGVISQVIASGNGNTVLLILGTVFLVAGLCFKLGAVPFHMWVPDVYEGSPTAITMVIGAAPKLAAFVFVVRILAESIAPLLPQWQGMLMIVAVLSIALGNITAIAQTNLKRMLAYSTIAHMGFLLLGFLTGTVDGYAAAMFYAIIYVLMALVAFATLMALSRAGFECETLADLQGLNQRSSWYAFLMLLAMFSMAGVPPLAGFYAKFLIIRAMLGLDLVGLSVFAVLMSLFGAFYYLRVVKAMYFDAPDVQHQIRLRRSMQLTLSVNGLLLLALGLLPQQLVQLCVDVVKQSLTAI